MLQVKTKYTGIYVQFEWSDHTRDEYNGDDDHYWLVCSNGCEEYIGNEFPTNEQIEQFTEAMCIG